MKDMKKTLLRAGVCLSLLLGVFATDAGAQSVDYSLARVQQREGYLIFYPGQTPVAAYEYVGTIDAGNMVKNFRASTMLEEMFKAIKKKGFTGDAIIFTEMDLWKADVIKFK